jgi:hypothetical protein
MVTTLSNAERTHDALRELGFTASRKGNSYRYNGLALSMASPWSHLQVVAAQRDIDPLKGQLGRPAPWKWTGSEQAGYHRIFDVPAHLLSECADEDGDDAKLPVGSIIPWAIATENGELPTGWEPPPREEAISWIRPQGLSLQVGPFARQGTLIHTPERLALRFPILPSIPADLPEPRRQWLRAILIEAQNRWRLVRIGLSDRGTAEAEVDLSGAPACVVESLLRTSLDAIRFVVEWLVWPAAFLADTSISCEAWNVCPVRV